MLGAQGLRQRPPTSLNTENSLAQSGHKALTVAPKQMRRKSKTSAEMGLAPLTISRTSPPTRSRTLLNTRRSHSGASCPPLQVVAAMARPHSVDGSSPALFFMTRF